MCVTIANYFIQEQDSRQHLHQQINLHTWQILSDTLQFHPMPIPLLKKRSKESGGAENI